MDRFTNFPNASCVSLLYQSEALPINIVSLKSVYRSCLAHCPQFVGQSEVEALPKGTMTRLKGNLTSATIYIRNANWRFSDEESPLIIKIDGCYLPDPNGIDIDLSWILTNEPYVFVMPNTFSMIHENMYDKFTTSQLKLNQLNSDCGFLYVEHLNLCEPRPENLENWSNWSNDVISEGNVHYVFIYFIIIFFAYIFFFLTFWFVRGMFFKNVNTIIMVAPVNGY